MRPSEILLKGDRTVEAADQQVGRKEISPRKGTLGCEPSHLYVSRGHSCIHGWGPEVTALLARPSLPPP